jgi:flagellin-specific chaperone FliS
MLAQHNPQTVYRRIDFDARVSTSDPGELVELCYEQLISALGTALFAQEKNDNRLKSEALTRAVSALTALQLGVSGQGSVVDALHQIYDAARRSVLDSVLRFKPATIAAIRQDFIDIARALGAAHRAR